MKELTARNLVVLVMFGILIIGLVVWSHEICEKQDEIHLHSDSSNGGKLDFLLSEEDTTEYTWSLEVEEGTQLAFIKSPIFTGDDIVYLGIEMVSDSILVWREVPATSEWTINSFKQVWEMLERTYLNLSINNTKYRIALEEVK